MAECNYRTKNVLQLLHRRQLGLPIKERGTSVRNSRSNYQCDFEILKTLLCDRQLHLEVIACRKVSRSAEPSFCHNRLFTNNYRSWFNLCTSPTSGPCLMKTNVFSDVDLHVNPDSTQNEGPKIVDAVTVDPPNGCNPLPNSQHLPSILLLSKSGWLYQFCLKDAALLNKIYLPTSHFANDFNEFRSMEFDLSDDQIAAQRKISTLNFRYQYITINGAEGRVLVRSCICMQDNLTYVAYALLGLFPLRILSHFVTKSTTPTLKAELWNDFFVLTAAKGSTVTLYSFEEIEKLHHMSSSHVKLQNKLKLKDLVGDTYEAEVGGADIGIPYTTVPIDLDKWKEWTNLQLFRTKAIRHILRVGGIPYHYAVAINNNYTSWSLRGLADGREITKFHVDEKWDQSHISGVDFHSDESGRLLVVNKGTVTVYKIERRRMGRTLESSPDEVQLMSTPRSSLRQEKSNSGKVITTSPISEPDSQLRVVDSVFGRTPPKNKPGTKSKYMIVKCFEIDVNKFIADSKIDLTSNKMQWRYPSQEVSPVAQSSYGRSLRQTRRYSGQVYHDRDTGVLGVFYEDELDLLAILHFGPPNNDTQTYNTNEPHSDLVVSLYDNKTGARLNTIIVEQDLVPSECGEVSLILDEDTIIYTRTEYNDVLNYKIMRFCRKY